MNRAAKGETTMFRYALLCALVVIAFASPARTEAQAGAAAQSCPKDSGVRLARKLLKLFELKLEMHSRFPRKENPRGGSLIVESNNNKRSYSPYTVEEKGFLSFEDLQSRSCLSFDKTWKKLVLETLLTRGAATGTPDSLKCPKDAEGRPDCGRLPDGLYYSPLLNIDNLIATKPFTAYFLGDNPEQTIRKIANCAKLEKAKNECRKRKHPNREAREKSIERCIENAVRLAERAKEPCEERDSPDVIAGGLYNGKGTFFGSACTKNTGWVSGPGDWRTSAMGPTDPIGTPVRPVEQLPTTGAATPGGGGKSDTELKQWLIANKALIKRSETTTIIPKLLDGAALTRQDCGNAHFNPIDVADRLKRARGFQAGLPSGCEWCIDWNRSPLLCNGRRDERKEKELKDRHLKNPAFQGGWAQKIQCYNLETAYNNQSTAGIGQNRFKVADRLNQLRAGMRNLAASVGCEWAPPGFYASEYRAVCGGKRSEVTERNYVRGDHEFRNTASAAIAFLRVRSNVAEACRCPEAKRVNFRLWDNYRGKSAVCFHTGILMAGFRSGSLSELNTYKDIGLGAAGLLTGGLALIPCLFSDACDDIRPTGEIAVGVDGAIEVKPEVSENDLRGTGTASLYDASHDAQPSADPFTPGTRLHLSDACLPYAAQANLPLRLACEESMASGCIAGDLGAYDPSKATDAKKTTMASCCNAKAQAGVEDRGVACCLAYVQGTLKKGDVVPTLPDGRRQCDDELRALMILSQELPYTANSAPVPLFNLYIRFAREAGLYPILTADAKASPDPLRFDLVNISKAIPVDFTAGHDRALRDHIRAACIRPASAEEYDATLGDANLLNPAGYASRCARTIWAAVYRGEAPKCALSQCSRRDQFDFTRGAFHLPPKPIPRSMVVLENLRRRGRMLDGRRFAVTPANDPKFFSMKLGVRTVGDPFKLSLNIRAADKGRLHNRVAWSPPVEVRFQANAEGLVMPYAFSAGPDGKFATIGGEVASDARIRLVGGEATARSICNAVFSHTSFTTLPGVVLNGLLTPIKNLCPSYLTSVTQNPLDTILTRVVPRIVQGVHKGLMLGITDRSVEDIAKRAVNLLFLEAAKLKGNNPGLTKIFDLNEWSKCWNAFLKNRRLDCKE